MHQHPNFLDTDMALCFSFLHKPNKVNLAWYLLMHQHPNFLDTDMSFCFSFLSSACSAVLCTSVVAVCYPSRQYGCQKLCNFHHKHVTIRLQECPSLWAWQIKCSELRTQQLISNIWQSKFWMKRTQSPLQLTWEPDFNGFKLLYWSLSFIHKSAKLDLVGMEGLSHIVSSQKYANFNYQKVTHANKSAFQFLFSFNRHQPSNCKNRRSKNQQVGQVMMLTKHICELCLMGYSIFYPYSYRGMDNQIFKMRSRKNDCLWLINPLENWILDDSFPALELEKNTWKRF